MTVERYRRKPEPQEGSDQVVARYTPGAPLDDLLTVAQLADKRAQLGELAMGTQTVLVVRWLEIPDDHPSRIKHEVVEAGKYLAYSPGTGFLYVSSERNWADWYERVPSAG